MTITILACLALLLVVAGVWTVAGTARSVNRWRGTTPVVGRVVRTFLAATVLITGAQLGVVAMVHDWRVLLVVLAVPAVLAAGTVARVTARVTAMTEITRGGVQR